MNDKRLIIIGASARAAAFSASRAGYLPYWLDQFGDEDLRLRFPGNVLSDYPGQAPALLDQAPAAPFIFTGALENHPETLEALCRRRTLLGNPKPVCLGVKDPFRLQAALRRRAIPCPEVRRDVDAPAPRAWLMKPRYGAGGSGIGFYAGQALKPGYYLQQYLSGESFSAVFVGGRGYSRLLGVTRQLVGLPEFHAGEFSYCGSIGPLELSEDDLRQWRAIGAAIGSEFELHGLFGVDAVRHQGRICPVEVNPRYTASVETLELVLGIQAVSLHCHACAGRPVDVEVSPSRRLIGKAVLYAPADLVFRRVEPAGFSIADIPAQGAEIKQGQPVLTIMVAGADVTSIIRQLGRSAARVIRQQSIADSGFIPVSDRIPPL